LLRISGINIYISVVYILYNCVYSIIEKERKRESERREERSNRKSERKSKGPVARIRMYDLLMTCVARV